MYKNVDKIRVKLYNGNIEIKRRELVLEKRRSENENIFQNFLFGRTDRTDADTQRRIVDARGKIGGKQQRCER